MGVLVVVAVAVDAGRVGAGIPDTERDVLGVSPVGMTVVAAAMAIETQEVVQPAVGKLHGVCS